jgi:hypothetical protein
MTFLAGGRDYREKADPYGMTKKINPQLRPNGVDG